MNKSFLQFLENKRNYFYHLINKEIDEFWDTNALKELTKIPNIRNVAYYAKSTLSKPSLSFFKMKGKMCRSILGYLVMKNLKSNPHKFTRYLILPEILHNASLIVDDIEDNAFIRRNKPTLHIKYGVDTAINTANALYYLPFYIIKKSKLSKETEIKVYDILIEAMHRIHIGQGLDILWHKYPALTVAPEQYIQMVKLKTSSFFRAEIQLASLFAKGNNDIQKQGIIFAENIGVIFQIIDDILDLTLENKELNKFGKTFAQDIKEGKKTLIIIYALKKADLKDRSKLIRILKLHTLQEGHFEEAIDILKKYDAFSQTKEFVYALSKKTWNDFSKLFKPSRAKDYLEYYYKFIIGRRF